MGVLVFFLMIKSTLVVLLLVLLARQSVSRGTLYLNEIQAYPDPVTAVEELPIECTLWVDNMVFLDRFDGIPAVGTGGGGDEFNHRGSGVEVDGVLLHVGTWVFPSDFDVAGTVTVSGLLQPNGGFFADDGDIGDANNDGRDYAFAVENDTGNTIIAGELRVQGEVSNKRTTTNPDGTFVINDVTGETTIAGLLSPNGGFDINGGEITVSDDGTTFASGNIQIGGDLILGTDQPETRNFVPYTNENSATPVTGGDTHIKGQDGAAQGGHIVLEPGLATGAAGGEIDGAVVLGLDDRSHALMVSRLPTVAGNAADFIFGGQESSGKGGDVVIVGGSALNNGNGGHVIFSPGQSNTYNGVTGARGDFYLGDPEDGAGIPFIMTRPDLTTAETAGLTSITGQDVTTGTPGSVSISAGDGTLAGGNVHLEPGMNGARQGNIMFGSANSGQSTLTVTRDVDDDILKGGPTWFIGQDSFGGDGGNLLFEGGRGSLTRSGDLYLSPGSPATLAGSTGTIFWGNNAGNNALFVVRPPTAENPAHDTYYHGQTTSATSNGGDLIFVVGSGNTPGGSGESGFISFEAGDGAVFGDAGSVFFSSQSGNVIFDAGELFLDAVPFFYDNNSTPGEFIIRDTATGLDMAITPNAGSGFLQLNIGLIVDTLLTDRIDLSNTFRPVINPYEDLVTAAQNFQDALEELRDGLIAHDLIEIAP